MDFTTSKRLFDLLVAPLRSFVQEAALVHNADYRTYKFSATQHVLLTIFAQLTHTQSANELVAELNDLGGQGQACNLRSLIGFNFIDVNRPVQLNQSSFSYANQHRSYRLWYNLRPLIAELLLPRGYAVLCEFSAQLLQNGQENSRLNFCAKPKRVRIARSAG